MANTADWRPLAPLTAQTLLALGRLEEVERYAFWGRDIAHPRTWMRRCRWRIAISGLRSQQGRHDEAIAVARDAVAILAQSELMTMRVFTLQSLGGALRAAGDEPGALATALSAKRLAAAKQDQTAMRAIEAFVAAVT